MILFILRSRAGGHGVCLYSAEWGTLIGRPEGVALIGVAGFLSLGLV